MSIFRPTSDERPGDQSSKTPSGKQVPMAMSMMVDSMVRMIQGANNNQSSKTQEFKRESVDEN